MATVSETTDASVLDLLRESGPKSVAEFSDSLGVTATAVRQRLTRLMASELIERTTTRAGRGRPSHRYSLTQKGQRSAGDNYGDLAIAMWNEIRSVKDPEVRRGLIGRIAETLAASYAGKITGDTVEEKMTSLAALFAERKIPFAIRETDDLPVLTALSCPYPELAEQDRSVCAMEKMLFSELVGTGLRLTDCRLDGAACCTFETS